MNKNKTFKALKYTALALIAVSAVLLTLAMLTVYEPDTNYFPANTSLPILAALLAILGALCGVISAFFLNATQTTLSPFYLPASLISGIGFLLGGILLLLHATLPWSVPTALLFLIAALYSFLTGSAYTKKAPAFLAFLGFLTVIACALGNVYCYFDVSLEMNAPVKTFLQIALLFSMVYYTGEIRFLLKREKRRFYLILAFCALAANGLCAIAFPIAYFQATLSRIDYFALSVSSLGMFLALLVRILCFGTPEKDFSERDENTNEDVNEDTEPYNDSPLPIVNAENSSSLADDDTEEPKETEEE